MISSIPRNPTPVENHRPTLSYSNVSRHHFSSSEWSIPTFVFVKVTRQGIPNQGHASHEGAIVGQKATAVPVINQTNMASQVSNVNPTGAQLSGAPVANTGSNQMQMIPNNVMQTSGPRFGHQTPFHQHQAHAPRQAQPRQNLLQNRHPTHAGSVPNSGVQQPVAQQHVQFYMPPNLQAQHLPQYQQNPNYITHNMAAHVSCSYSKFDDQLMMIWCSNIHRDGQWICTRLMCQPSLPNRLRSPSNLLIKRLMVCEQCD